VRFQPYIKGEKIILVTDHSALQWARTYENANRRLAAWGSVFSVYTPGLEIVHRAGRIHSKVDPLSRLPRSPPDHTSPAEDTAQPIVTNGDLAAAQEAAHAFTPAAKATFTAYTLDDCAEGSRSVFTITRSRSKAPLETNSAGAASDPSGTGGKATGEHQKEIPWESPRAQEEEHQKETPSEAPKDSRDLIDEVEPSLEYWGQQINHRIFSSGWTALSARNS
jgi:hypothetical protein